MFLGSSMPFFPGGGIGGLGGGFSWLNSLAQEPAVGVGGQGKQGISCKLHGETVTQSLATSERECRRDSEVGGTDAQHASFVRC